jgi:serine phosphatase RsbU (regulator of sigma subunit)
MKIYVKLTLLAASLVIASSAVLFLLTDNQVKKTLRQEILSNISNQSKQSVDNIERFVFSRLNDVRMASKNPYFRISDISKDELNARLQELEALSNLYHSFSFFDMNRVRLADSKGESIGIQHSNTSYWRKLQKNETALDIAMSEATAQPMMHFATIVKDYYTDAPIGVLVGTVRMSEIYRLMGDFTLSDDATRKLDVNWVDSNGLLLYSNTNPNGILKENYPKFDLIKGKNGRGVNVVETTDELLFVTKDKGYLNYEGSDWKLIMSISSKAAFAPLDELRNQLLVVIAGALLVSLILALFVSNIFVKPIIALTKAAEEIGKGKLKTAINLESKDEIGTLARNLHGTTQALIKRIEEQKILNKRLQDKMNELESQKVDIEEIHKEVKDSINYSQRIQKSILPDSNELKRVFNDKLLLYRPKDVVSGDFYWFERVRTGRKEHMIIIAADCTGHGVPGAIMSMVGSNQLTNIVYYQNYIEPHKILARLDKAIKFELYRDLDEDQPRHDGMEAGVCVVDLDTMEMTYSGAGIPLYFIRDGQIEIYKTPKVTIGRMEGTEKEVEDQFQPMTFHLQEGDRIYLASDGFQDQFGGPSDKRFMNKNFRNLLLVSGQDKTMAEQERKLNQVFDHWKGNSEQTDDVLVLGFEV